MMSRFRINPLFVKTAVGANSRRLAKLLDMNDVVMGRNITPQLHAIFKAVPAAQRPRAISRYNAGQGWMGETMKSQIPLRGYGLRRLDDSVYQKISDVKDKIYDKYDQLVLDSSVPKLVQPSPPSSWFERVKRLWVKPQARLEYPKLDPDWMTKKLKSLDRAHNHQFKLMHPTHVEYPEAISSFGRTTPHEQASISGAFSQVQAGHSDRFKGGDLGSMRDIAKGEPIWYSPQRDVASGYALGRGDNRGVLLRTTEDKLREFGPLGPTTGHLAKDSRQFTPEEASAITHRTTKIPGADVANNYEQVATMPEWSKFIDSHDIFIPRHDKLKPWRQVPSHVLTPREVLPQVKTPAFLGGKQ